MNLEAIALSRISCAVSRTDGEPHSIETFLVINFRIQLLDPSEQFSRPRNMVPNQKNRKQ